MRLFAILFMCCALFISVAAVSQTRSGEGVSRQVQAMRSLLNSFRDHVDDEIERVDDRVDAVDLRVDGAITRMDAMDGRMDNMDGRMDRLRSDIRSNDRRITALENGETGVQPKKNCAQRNVTWGGGNCRATQGPIPHGTSLTVRDTVQGDICTNRRQHVGYAVYSCNDGVVTRVGQACQETDFYNATLCEGSTDTGTNCNSRHVTWAGTSSWTGGSIVCSGVLPSIPHGTTGTARDTASRCAGSAPGDFVTGTSRWTCTNGALNMISGSCTQDGDWGSVCK